MGKLVRENNMCFACSSINPIGLRLKFEQDGPVCRTHFTSGPEHQGWNGVLHGGLISTMLDEAMSQWIWARDYVAVTAEITTRFSVAVPIGQPITIEAALEAERGLVVEMSGKVILPDGTVAARCKAKFLKVDWEKMRQGELKLHKK